MSISHSRNSKSGTNHCIIQNIRACLQTHPDNYVGSQQNQQKIPGDIYKQVSDMAEQLLYSSAKTLSEIEIRTIC